MRQQEGQSSRRAARARAPARSRSASIGRRRVENRDGASYASVNELSCPHVRGIGLLGDELETAAGRPIQASSSARASRRWRLGGVGVSGSDSPSRRPGLELLGRLSERAGDLRELASAEEEKQRGQDKQQLRPAEGRDSDDGPSLLPSFGPGYTTSRVGLMYPAARSFPFKSGPVRPGRRVKLSAERAAPHDQVRRFPFPSPGDPRGV